MRGWLPREHGAAMTIAALAQRESPNLGLEFGFHRKDKRIGVANLIITVFRGLCSNAVYIVCSVRHLHETEASQHTRCFTGFDEPTEKNGGKPQSPKETAGVAMPSLKRQTSGFLAGVYLQGSLQPY